MRQFYERVLRWVLSVVIGAIIGAFSAGLKWSNMEQRIIYLEEGRRESLARMPAIQKEILDRLRSIELSIVEIRVEQKRRAAVMDQ